MPPALETKRPSSWSGHRPARRWLVVLVVSLLIHLTVIDALPHITLAASAPGDLDEPLRARLVPAVSPVASPAAAPEPVPPPRARTPPRRVRPAPSLRPAPFVPESMEAPAQVVVPDPSPARAAPAAPVPPPPMPVVPADVPPAPPAPPAAPAAAAIAPPQSARLDYQVLSQKINETNPIYGVGTIDWSADHGTYAIDLKADAKLAFFSIGVLASHSEGTLGPQGLAPDRYTESPRKRGTLAVNFNRDARQSVTFSASPAAVPLASGVQDRLSILFQVGGLLLADPSQGAQGTRFEVPVAGVRGDVDVWTFESSGREPVVTTTSNVPSTHLRRVPKPGSSDRAIDLWVADDGGYPARVVYTERDGSTITMTLERVSAVH